MVSRVALHGVVAFLLWFVAVMPVSAAWPPDGTSVVAAVNNQEVRAVVPDGAGGVIVVWMDKRQGAWHENGG